MQIAAMIAGGKQPERRGSTDKVGESASSLCASLGGMSLSQCQVNIYMTPGGPAPPSCLPLSLPLSPAKAVVSPWKNDGEKTVNKIASDFWEKRKRDADAEKSPVGEGKIANGMKSEALPANDDGMEDEVVFKGTSEEQSVETKKSTVKGKSVEKGKGRSTSQKRGREDDASPATDRQRSRPRTQLHASLNEELLAGETDCALQIIHC